MFSNGRYRISVEAAGFVGLLLFCYGIFIRTTIVNVGFALMSLAYAASLTFIDRKSLRDPILLLSLLFFLFLFLRAFAAWSEFGDYERYLLKDQLRLFNSSFIWTFLTSYWMYRFKERWALFIWMMLAGFFTSCIQEIPWTQIIEQTRQYLLVARRAAFISSAINFGLWCTIIFLACTILYRQLWGSMSTPARKLIIILLWSLLLLTSLLGVFFSYSKTAWLAFLSVLPPVAVYRMYISRKRGVFIALAGLALFILGSLAVVSNISDRVIAPMVVAMREASDGKPVSASESVRLRLLMYELFREKWRLRPWMGYGPAGPRILLHNASGDYSDISNFNHFHNSYMEILIKLGIIGLLFYAAFIYLVCDRTVRAMRAKFMDREYFLFVFTGFAVVLIGSMFNETLNNPKGVYLTAFLSAMGYAVNFKSYRRPVADKAKED